MNVTINIAGICAINEPMISVILAKIGCKGMEKYVNETEATVTFNLEVTTEDEMAMAIGHLVLNDFTVTVE